MAEKIPYWQMKQLVIKMQLEHLQPEERLDIDHDHCPAGYDRKKRLNIRRKDNVILFRCNHCGRGGGYRLSAKQAVAGARRPAAGARAHKGVVHSGYPQCSLPVDFSTQFETFAGEARVWLRQYLREGEIRQWAIGYSPSLNRVILPIYREGKLKAYQARRLKDDDGPKYISYGLHGEKYLYCQHEEPASTLVVCEDYLSAVKCYRYADSVALLGIAMPDEVMDKVLKHDYDRVVVWLDHDNTHVTKQERKLVRRLEMYVNNVVYIKNTDPKKVSDEVLKGVLTDDYS